MLRDWLCTHEKQLDEIMYSHNTLAQICEKGYVNYLCDSYLREARCILTWNLAVRTAFLIEIPLFNPNNKKIEVYEYIYL